MPDRSKIRMKRVSAQIAALEGARIPGGCDYELAADKLAETERHLNSLTMKTPWAVSESTLNG
jgi:hypothetical protein